MKFFKLKNSKSGFTLMEMLIVVVIIAILALIAVPLFTSNLDEARKSVDEANIQTAKTCAVLEYIQNDISADSDYYLNISSGGLVPYTAANNSVAYQFETNGVSLLGLTGASPSDSKPYLKVTLTADGNVEITAAAAANSAG